MTNASRAGTFRVPTGNNAIIEDTLTCTQARVTQALVHKSDLAANYDYSGEVDDATAAGESVVSGDAVHIGPAGLWLKSDSDASDKPGTGVALEDKSAGETLKVLLHGFYRHPTFSYSTAGEFIYISTDAGVMTQTPSAVSGDYVQKVGWLHNVTNDIIRVWPDLTIIKRQD
jgi:hypothetical protein